MIPAICIVPEEYSKEKWPRSFAAKPRVGELVEARSGQFLIVHQVIHAEDNINSPHIKVKLTR